MNSFAKHAWWTVLLFLSACSVMPAAVEQAALPDMPFDELIAQASQYKGRTVILGGYVIKVTNEPQASTILALEAPLGIGQEPKSKDLSRGRLLLSYPGFLDPEIYAKDRRITVAGKLVASSATEQGRYPFPYLRIDVTNIHLWPEKKPVPYDPYWDYWGAPYYYYPWGWRHPYWW